ncbi:MAG: formate dehydrogenase accessory sulfurtransferase FdhD [Alphaproteobacteria bacterium]|nr:MAG: formate dehydrogenase accessory sulfurtransferase FdhD [Alphaproteobacteria bacterium]
MSHPRTGHVTVKAYNREGQHKKEIDKNIASEVPVAFVYNDISHAVMMCTPQDLEDFALGFSLSEGIIDKAADIKSIDIREEENGLLLTIQIPDENLMGVLRRKRNLSGSTSCSLCGIESLEEALRMPLPLESPLQISANAIYKAYDDLPLHQPEKQITGAVHGAAFVDGDGNIMLLREDVGRHNALDKLIGASLTAGISPRSGFVLLTSRCSSEMVQKAVSFGAPILAAISAPTNLAVTLADAANLTLAALVRKEMFITFTHPDRIIAP